MPKLFPALDHDELGVVGGVGAAPDGLRPDKPLDVDAEDAEKLFSDL